MGNNGQDTVIKGKEQQNGIRFNTENNLQEGE